MFRRWAVLGLLSLFALISRAETVGIVITATGLTRSDGTPLPDNSLIQVIANTAGQTPGAPTVSTFATGSDVVLASFPLDSSTTGIGGSFQVYLTVDRSAFPGLNPGAPLLLRWYDLSYAPGQRGPGTAVYGQFTTTAVVDGSTSGWTLDADGNNAALNFITVANGGSQPPAAGKTTFIVAPPAVTAISPALGVSTGGTVVTLTGTAFTGATAVMFGAGAGTNLTVVNDTSITVTAPPGAAGTVDVTVTTANGTSATSAADQFTYVVAPSIATAPQTQTVAGAGSTTLSVVAGGTGPFTYQWYLNGAPLAGQTGASLTLASVATADAGAYTVTVTNAVGSITSDPATLTVGPYITSSPVDASVGVGGSQTFRVTAAGSGALTYQWRKGLTPIAGANGATFVLDPVTVADAGRYNVVVSGSGLSATSSDALLTVLPNPIVRTATTTIADANGVSAYFAIEGTAPKQLVLAAYGPALTSVTGAITDPQIEVLDATGATVATNNDWGTITDPTFASTSARLGLTPLASGSRDAAVYATLAAGTYRVRVTGVGGATGVVRIALADADLNPASRVAWFAVRGPLSPSSPLTAGFALTSPATTNLLFRAIGPSLGTAGHPDPVLKVYDIDGTSVLSANDNWGGGETLATAFAQDGAFPLASASTDAAVGGAMRLAAGAYTAQVSAVSGTGDVLWELYDPDGTTPASFAPMIVLPPTDQAFGSGTVTLTAVAVGGGTLAYQWKKDGVVIAGATNATYTLANPTASDAGTYTVQVTNSAGTASASAILKALPVVTSGTSATGTYGTAFSFAVTASASPTSFGATNLPAGLSINATTGVISGTPTSVGVTTATVTATNANGTGSASLQITIGRRTLVVTPDSGLTKVYGSTDPVLTYAVGGDGLAGGDTLTGALGRAAGEGIGSYAITPGTLAANANYDLSVASGSFTITPRPITISANSGQAKTYGAADPAAYTCTLTSGALVSGDSISGSAARAAGEAAGSYAINQGTLTAGPNYAVTFVPANFTIAKAVLTVTADNQTRPYGAANPIFTSVITGFVGTDNLANCVTGAPDLTTPATATSPQGTYPIAVALHTLAAANYSFTLVDGTMTVTKAELVVTADPQSRAYGAVNPAPTYTITGFLGTDTAAVVTGLPVLTHSATSASPVGTYGIAVALGSLAANNYTFRLVDGQLTVTKAMLTVTAESGLSKTYGDSDPALTYTIGGSGLVGSDTLTGAVTRDAGENVGSYAIEQGTLSAGANYDLSFTGASFTITARPITISANSGQAKTYGMADPAAYPCTLTSGALVSGDSISGAAARTAGEAAGTYAINQGTLTAGSNYAVTFVPANFTIAKAVLTVTADNLTRPYGAANPIFTSVITGFVGTDNLANCVTGAPDLTTTATTTSPQGTYPIAVALHTLAAANYSFTLVDGALTVTRAELVVTADPQTRVYGAVNPAPTYTITGFLGTDTAAVVTGLPVLTHSATSASPVGTYGIALALGSLAANNYTFRLVDGQLTVTKAMLTVTPDPQTKVYGAPVPDAATFTATLGGFVNGETLATSGVTGAAAVTTAVSAASGVAGGPYPLTATTGTLASANYTFTFTPGVYTVTPAPLTVTADAKTMVYGGALPALTATVSGFVNGETLATSDVTGAPAFTTDASPASPVGTYAITPAAGSLAAANYTFAFAPGTLSVTQAPVSITLSNLSQVYDGRSKQVSVTASPSGVGLSVGYTPSQPVEAGSYRVTVVVTDLNYVGSASGTLTINNASQTVAISAPATASLGTPVPVSATSSSGLPVTLSAVGPATLSGGQLTFTSPGTVTLTATQAGNNNHAAASATATVTVAGRTAQTITFAGISDRLSNSGPFALNATASSGLPVSFAIVSGPAMLSGNTVTLTGAAGQVLVRASQAGNALYDPAPDVTVLFTVTAATLNVFFGTVTNSGSTAKAGDIAATLPPNSRQGNLLVVAPDVGLDTVLDFTLNDNNTFVLTVTPEVQGLDTGATGRQALSASSLTLTLRGSLVNGRLSGVIEPLGLVFSAAVLPVAGPSANAAGFYTSSALGTKQGATYTVVGTNNQVLVLASTPDVTTGGLTTLNSNGTFGLQAQTAAGAATISGTVDTSTTTVAGTIAVPGKPDTSFAGLVVSTTRTDRLINLSSRASVGTGDHVLVTGFVIGGSDPKPVLIRGVGPSLAGFGVPGTLANPRIRVYHDGQLVAENAGWSTGTNAGTVAAVTSRLGGFALPDNSADAALLATLAPGAYTAEVTDASPGGTPGGVALAEIYDASTNPNADYQRLVNISTRGDAGTGDNVLVGGFVVRGNSPKKLLIRGIGPALVGFGVADALKDPRLRVYQGAALIAENDNWSDAADADVAALKAAMRDTGAFALPDGSRDAAIVLTLAPGSYTAQVGSSDGVSTGIALVEIYEIPQ